MSSKQQVPQLPIPLEGREVVFKNYIVAFIDIQGQRDWLDKMAVIPKSQDEMQTFEVAARETLDAICLFRMLFNTYFKAYLDVINNDFVIGKLLGNQEGTVAESDSLEVGFQGFSDTIIVFIPKENRNGKIQWRALHALFASFSILIPILLAKEIIVRGGIELGIGVEFVPGEIYGPVLKQAYHLEDKVAMYPRIVVGSELAKWIDSSLQQVWLKVEDKIAFERHGHWVAIDYDGITILDYLGQSAILIGGEVTRTYIKSAFDIVCSKRSYFAGKDDYLFNKYDLLMNYFKSRKTIFE